MPRSSHRTTTFALLAAVLSSPSSAAIVQVRYEGTVSVVGAGTAGFTIGDRVWGEYFYDSSSPPIVGSIYNSEHAAIRYLSVNASNGFAGAVNSGAIQNPTVTISHNHSLFPPNFYRVTNMPATVLSGIEWDEWLAYVDIVDGVAVVPPSEPFDYSNADGVIIISNGIADDIDHDGNFGPDGIDTETSGDVPDPINPSLDFDDVITFGPDLDSLYEAAIRSASLGFPAPSGAFAHGNPLAIHLLMFGDASLQETAADPLAPPALDAVHTAKGSINFGYFGTDDPRYKVQFALTMIAVVPEPASIIVAFVGMLATASRQRLRQVV